ncbi:hypothetical protein THAOC_33983 [Thalassiosira oceanica]|uniref:Cytochrome P450 n=1 Tax=Thalassiosira oceanica TaxID=159749 RepID=K0RE27_THAOC|nr:hypothetical protein THAOC_33983 [Thalassiosira oceanica]|eukprot:EJK47306.1 hypothetical protein THAOC_33983 [Thalassiosira oceanica]
MALPLSGRVGDGLVDELPLVWSTPLLICAIATFLGVAKVTSLLSGNRKSAETLPPYAPGSMLKHIEMVTSKEYPWWLLDVAEKLGQRCFRVSIPSSMKNKIIIGEHTTARRILTDPLSSKPIEIYSAMRFLNNKGDPGMFTLNGPSWHSKRKASANAFSSNLIRRMNEAALDYTDVFVENLKSEEPRGVFDVSEAMLSVVLSALTESAFDYVISVEESADMMHDLELALIEFASKTPTQIHRNWFSWLIPERRRAVAATLRLRELMCRIMNNYRENGPKSDGTIIQLIMENDSAFKTDDEKLAQLLEFFIAGHETTAYSISWVLTCLARNPQIQAKLRSELSALTPQTWSQSKYLQMCIKEGMRLYPVAAAGSIRNVGKDLKTEGGFILPKGSTCFIPMMLVLNNPDVYENPREYNPSRWEHPTREMMDCFIPFSLGKQNCIGQSLANAEMQTIISRLCSEFDISVEEEGRIEFFLTLKQIGTKLRAKKVE